MPSTQFDIIIAGTGLAGLALALELARRPAFRDRRVLLLDRDRKQKNDRTWCFWATDDEPLPPVVFKTWDKCLFFGEKIERPLNIGPYRYRMVRGLDFYEHAKTVLAARPNFEWLTTEIEQIEAETGTVRTAAGAFSATWVFSSIVEVAPPQGEEWSAALLQHFKGWLIETPDPVFDPSAMTFMDFRVAQHRDTRFVYVLPFDERRALVEFTVFSPALLAPDEYDSELTNYLHNFLKISDFKIEDTEFGVIPMTDHPFRPRRDGRLVRIGTAAGFVKGSSGYAFKRTLRKVRQLVDDWEKTGQPSPEKVRSAWRFRLYDSIFLRVFADHFCPPKRVFSHLFRGQAAHRVFRFLDEDTTFAEEPRILTAAPFWPFVRAFFRQLPVFRRI
ncbi:MAG: lycopene cyclase family protein [Saprospiraceae bacterium]